MSLTYVKASCHCGLNTFQIPFLTSDLPQASDLCHCNSCRHITGQLAVHCAIIEGRPLAADPGLSPNGNQPADLSNLSKYAASEKINRYFCSKCSAYMLYETLGGSNPHWSISTGALEKTEGIVKVGYHSFVGDTMDGGLADHYRTLDGKDIPRYELEEDGKMLPVGWRSAKIGVNRIEGSDEKLSAYCHCKTISLYVTRGKQGDAIDEKKYWLVPATENDPSSRVRFIAGHCVCTSCRLTSGALIQSNIILPRANVFDAHTSKGIKLAIPKDGTQNDCRPRGLIQYESSPGTFREFCGTCGATVFYWSKAAEGKHMPIHEGDETEAMDLASGLVDQECVGARADGWVVWSNKVHKPEDAIDKAGVASIQDSIKDIPQR